jgi:hypothetical protein
VNGHRRRDRTFPFPLLENAIKDSEDSFTPLEEVDAAFVVDFFQTKIENPVGID